MHPGTEWKRRATSEMIGHKRKLRGFFPSEKRFLRPILLLALFPWFGTALALGDDPAWIRAGLTTNSPVWGLEGGLQFALHPGGFAGQQGGPRGLIRIGYPTLPNGVYDLVNFIAVEPIVGGTKGYSELERSSFDEKPGKLFWTGDKPEEGVISLHPGEITSPAPGVQELSVTVRIEPFENGAHVRLKLAQRTDAPGELRLTVEAEEGSAAIEACILTATMGNKARARLLVLKDGPVSSLQLYPDYREPHFAPHRLFPLERLARNAANDVFAVIINDEENPAAVDPFGRPHFWDYHGFKVNQYWRKPGAEVSPGLTCAVNARFAYWGGQQPIPGGVSFENFEFREPFRSGQIFIFGISRPNPSAVLRGAL